MSAPDTMTRRRNGEVLVDPDLAPEERREALYAGALVLYTHLDAVAEFAEFTRGLIEDAFKPHDPRHVHEILDRDELADVLVEFKPRFIHHQRSKEFVRAVVAEAGESVDETFFDVPKLRSAYPSSSLTTGIAYAFQPHRDTWYAAPQQQINWWMPVYPVAPTNAMRFYPRYHGRAIPNDSVDYNYYRANQWRADIRAMSGDKDPRVHPAPQIPLDEEPALCVVPPLGGILLFSGDQLHATIPNTSGLARYSIDFRTVHGGDVADGRGAPVIDVACAGTALRDFVNGTSLERLPDDVIARYDTPGALDEGVAVFDPTSQS